MRQALIIATAAASLASGLGLSVAYAGPDYPYCTVAGGREGYENCSYPSFGACRAAVSGVGGFCQINPRFADVYDPRDDQSPRRQSRRAPR